MEIKDILKLERHKKNMTQQDVADYLNLARGSYAKYETGANIPTTENILKLADLYNVATDYLLGRYEKKSQEPSNPALNYLYKNFKKVYDLIAVDKAVLSFFTGLSMDEIKKFLANEMPFSQFESNKAFKKLTKEQQLFIYKIRNEDTD